MPFKKEDIAYLAGLVDGEGCVYIAKHFNKDKSLRYRIRLQVSNTNREVLDWVQQNWKGWIYEHEWENNWKTRYDWVIGDGRAIKVLKELLPYLRIKRQQALNAIAMREGKIGKEKSYEMSHLFNRKGKYVSIQK